MNSQFNKKGLMTALSASAFALGSFAVVNAYAVNSCEVCTSLYDTCKDIPPPVNPVTLATPEMIAVMWLYCFEQKFGQTQESCDAAVGQEVWVGGHGWMEIERSWFRENTLCPGNLAKDVELTATLNGTGVNLKLTTSAEPDTAKLLIYRGDMLDNGGTKVKEACRFASGGSPYACTDAVVGDTYRVLEIEYDGDIILYDEVTPK